jgi:hypothetical protein
LEKNAILKIADLFKKIYFCTVISLDAVFGEGGHCGFV